MGIDWSLVAFEVLNFGVLVIVIRRFLFRPIREALEKRRAEIEGVREESERREAEAAATQQRYEAKLRDLDTEAQQHLDAASQRAREEAGRIVDAARGEGRRLADVTAKEAEDSRRLALEGLRREVIELAAEAAKRVVAHTGAPSVARAYARKGAAALLDALGGARPTEPVTLDVGQDSDPAELEQVVREVLGASVDIEARVDADIVAGVRLRHGGHEVSSSASATLERWDAARVSGASRPPPMLGQTG